VEQKGEKNDTTGRTRFEEPEINIRATRTTFGLAKPSVMISINSICTGHAHNIKHWLFIRFYIVLGGIT
jgi:hypothetical protein